MFTRLVQRKRPRRAALFVIGATAALAVGISAVAVLANIPPPPADTTCTGTGVGQLPNSIEVPNKNTSADCTTSDGALVSYIGSSDTLRQSSGTGLFDPFVRLQGSPTEQGFNTNAPVTFDAKTGTWTHAILVSAIPVITINGTRYWELFNDINEGNNTKHISLNRVEIWFTTNANITDGTGTFTGFAAPASLRYAFSGEIRINDVNSGSGRGDLRYLVPLTNIPTPPAGTYFVLYSQWGTTSATYNSDGGFEEWKVRKAPAVGIVKTANPVGPVNAGSTIGFDITVSNTGAADATGVTITDPLPAGAGNDLNWSLNPAFSGCAITGAVGAQTLNCTLGTVAAGGSVGPIHITSGTTAADCATVSNTATVASTNDGGSFSTATVDVNCGALLIKKESTKGTNPLVTQAGAVFCYSATMGCTTTTSVTDTTDGTLGDEDSTTGEVCVSGLAPGVYYVNETSPPTGYGAADGTQANRSVTVANGTNCTTSLPATAATATFTNPPLYDLQVNFKDDGSTETSATITCHDATPTTLTPDSTAPPSPWDTSSTYTNRSAPATITCTITVDP